MGTLKKRKHPFYWTSTPSLDTQVGTSVDITLSAYVTNPQNRTLAYYLHSGSLPAGLSVVGDRVTGTPTSAVTEMPQFRCTDGLYDSVSYPASFTVISAPTMNQPPVWNSIPSVSFTEGTPASYNLGQHVTDPEGDTVYYTLASGNLPAGVTLDEGGLLEYDGIGAADSQEITVDATDEISGPSTPEWQAIPNVSFVEGQAATIDLTGYAYYADGPLYYSEIGSLPSGVSLVDGLLVYDGVGGVGQSTISVTSTTTPVSTSEFKFAEIPQSVFVAGLADTDQMGIYMLDSGNLWTPGDLTRSSGWTAAQGREVSLVDATTLQAVSDAYLSLDASTGELTYSGGDYGAYPHDLDVRLEADGVYSDAFKIRVLVPTCTFGDDDYDTVLTAAGTSVTGSSAVTHQIPGTDGNLGNIFGQVHDPASDHNCLLLTEMPAGTDVTECYYGFSLDDSESCYLIGLPGKTDLGFEDLPWVNKAHPTLPQTDVTTINCYRITHVHVKNVVLWRMRIRGSDCRTWVFDKVDYHQYAGGDGFKIDSFSESYPFSDRLAYVYFSTMSVKRGAAFGGNHPFYTAANDDPQGYWSGMDATLYFNNVWSRGNGKYPINSPTYDYLAGRSQGEIDDDDLSHGRFAQGGINVKVTAMNTVMRNCLLESTDDWNDPYVEGYQSSQMLSVTAQSRFVGYNIHFRMGGKPAKSTAHQDSTVYAVGDVIYNANRHFVCVAVTGDATSGVGTPPTTKDIAQVDGNVTWWSCDPGNIGQNDFIIFQNRTTLGGGQTNPGFFWDSAAPVYIPESAGAAPLVMSYEAPGAPAIQRSTTYATGAYVTSLGRTYICTSGGTTSSDPNDVPDDYSTGTGTGKYTDGTCVWAWCGDVCPDFHGTNTYLTPPGPAPFWSTVGDPTDPTNANGYYKFISHCTFEWVDSSVGDWTETMPANATSDRGTSPTCPTSQFVSNQIFYNVPSNWTERSQVWMANNAYSDNMSPMAYTARYEHTFDHTGLAAEVHTYATDLNTARPFVVLGGETWESNPNSPVTLPGWFKY